MKQFKYIAGFFTIIFLHIIQPLVSQDGIKINEHPEKQPYLSPLSKSDSLALVGLPVITFDESRLKSSLPSVLDNSGQPYFRPLFEQVASECGQYASIAFNFTYEINYTRNTPANIAANQYPTHYTYNFMNGGFGWHGVSYFHSFEIARINGHPSVEDFGFMNSCGPSYWMSGYPKYYQGMFNKIDEVYQIPVGTPEGLLILKNWLHNHLTGDDVGGIACFYSSTPWNLKLLPQGTPEGGKHVISEFLSPATHSSTITGYNDSIRYDYNEDGQYTNHIDINGDGLVDMKDWEIGGLLFTDSYIGGVNWADSGFCYMMYKTLADMTGQGGIWNNAVHVVRIKEEYSPLLTMKVNIEHNCRDRLKIMAGVSGGPGSSFPEQIMGFPIFDFQGGCQNMQGGWEPEALALELGLDITPLLGSIDPVEGATFFLLVYENDPNGWGNGKVIDYSVIDHMNNDQEYPCPETNSPLVQNGLTLLSVDAAPDFDGLTIDTEMLPTAFTGEPYNHQMEAGGGTPPYSWKLVRSFSESDETGTFPVVEAEQLEFTDTIHSQALKVLEFGFPFYGQLHDSVWVHTNGFIMFDEQVYPWPYLYDERLMIRKTRNISPFLNDFLYMDPGSDDGVWYEGDENQAAFRWKMSVKLPQPKVYEFALVLHKDGSMEFHYDDEAFITDNTWAAGVSLGDGISYQFLNYSPYKSMSGDRVAILTPLDFPDEMTLSKEGILSGTPDQNYPGVDLVFDITDANLLNRRKTLQFHSYVADIGETPILPDENINLWPNPARERMQIEFYLAEKGQLSIDLTDPAGRPVMGFVNQRFQKGLNTMEIDLSAVKLKPGIYYVVFSRSGQVIGAKKAIITN